MRFWRTWLAAAVALGLGAFIYFVERPRIADESGTEMVLEFDSTKVATLQLLYPGEPEIVIGRDGDAWRLRQPIDFPADRTAVERLLQQIAETKAERRIKAADAEPLATYGLDGDGKQARITLTLADGTKVPGLVVGNTTPVGYSAFARVEGRDEILLTPLLLHTGVKKTVLDLRDKRVFDVDGSTVTAIRVGAGERAVHLERRGDDWMIVSPNEARADKDEVRGLISALNAIQAIDFHDSPVPGGDGTDSPAIAFHATVGDGKELGFQLGKSIEGEAPNYYLRRDGDGLVVTVDQSVKIQFDKDRSALRDKRLFLCDESEVGEVRFDRMDGSGFALARSQQDEWSIKPAPASASLRQNIARRTVAGLITLAGNEIASENADSPAQLIRFGLDSPVVEVEVLTREGSSCGRALAGVIGADTQTPAYYAKRADSGMVVTIPSYLYSRLDVRRDDLVATTPPSPTPAAKE